MSLNLPTGFLELDEQTTPSTNPPAGRRLIYPKSTGWYELDSGGTESLLGILDHGGLSGLSDDDHPIYPLLLGRSLGQAIYGSPDSGENLDLYGTSHATQGTVRVRDSDLGLDDYNKVAAADRRIRNLSGILSLTNTAQVEGRYLSKDSIVQLGTADLSDGSTLTTYVANALDAAELQQLQAIGATTISAAQWAYIGALDQALATTDSPTFAALTLTAALTEVNGGTGQAAYASGDILYSDATNSLARLAKGTNGHVLTLAAGLPSWAAAAGGGGGGAGTSELLHKNFSASQTTASSGDQDLATYTMPADTLSTGDVLEWTAFGRVNDGTGSEGLRLKFGAATLHTEAPGADRSFYARVMIHQDGASDQRVLYTAGSSGNWAAAADTTEDETGTIAIKFVGFQDAGASAGRATFYAHTITIHRAP